MQFFFQTHLMLFFILVAITGLMMGFLIYRLNFFIPLFLQKQWHIQSWQYLYPHCEMPETINKTPDKMRFKLQPCIGLMSLVMLLSSMVAYYFGPSWMVIIQLVLLWGLLLLACIDFNYYLLPDCLTLSLLWLGLFCNSFGLFVSVDEAIWGAITGYLSLWLVAVLFKWYRGKDGIGQGDVKLLAALGAWWGVYTLPIIIMIASFAGATVGLIQIASKRHHFHKPLPFGPYLVLAGLVIMFFKQQIKDILC